MDLVTPGIGLIFWMTLVFFTVLFILKKFAWRPILDMIKERETTIEDALKTAEQTRIEMEKLKTDNEALLKEAREERNRIIREAKEAGDHIIAEARAKSQEEGDRILKATRETIRNEKMAAITELKNQVATLSIEIAEKMLREELSSGTRQKALIGNMLEEVSLN